MNGDGCRFSWTYNTMFITSAAYGAQTKRGSMMRVEVWGGAGEYGRSCYFVKIKRQKYYLIVVLIGHIRIVIQK